MRCFFERRTDRLAAVKRLCRRKVSQSGSKIAVVWSRHVVSGFGAKQIRVAIEHVWIFSQRRQVKVENPLTSIPALGGDIDPSSRSEMVCGRANGISDPEPFSQIEVACGRADLQPKLRGTFLIVRGTRDEDRIMVRNCNCNKYTRPLIKPRLLIVLKMTIP